MEKKFNVVFSGKLVEGINPSEVLKRLCVALNMEEAAVRELFKQGNGAVVGKDLDGQQAYNLRDRLRDAGVHCTLLELAPKVQEPLSGCMETVASRTPLEKPSITPRTPRTHAQPSRGPGYASLFVKLLVVAALAGGGWYGYRTWFAPPSPAYQIYEEYAEAMARGEYRRAAELSQGDAKEYAQSWLAKTAPRTMKVYGKNHSMNTPAVSDIAGDIAWIKRKKKSEIKKSETAVALTIEETVCRIPPGVSSAVCKWPVTFRHDVELTRDGDAWIVTDFNAERLTPQEPPSK